MKNYKLSILILFSLIITSCTAAGWDYVLSGRAAEERNNSYVCTDERYAQNNRDLRDGKEKVYDLNGKCSSEEARAYNKKYLDFKNNSQEVKAISDKAAADPILILGKD
jgi:uncharacterized protein YxeA